MISHYYAKLRPGSGIRKSICVFVRLTLDVKSTRNVGERRARGIRRFCRVIDELRLLNFTRRKCIEFLVYPSTLVLFAARRAKGSRPVPVLELNIDLSVKSNGAKTTRDESIQT